MNQNPEQLARDRIDQQLIACGWIVQNKSSVNLHAGTGIAVREYHTNIRPADYVLFIDGKPAGLIEAKRKEEGVHLTVHDEQSKDYAESRLKYFKNDALPFVYESTGELKQEIESRLSVCNKIEETITDGLKQAEALRQSILKKAFEAKLT
jgi:type I restriction enzyme R subunit